MVTINSVKKKRSDSFGTNCALDSFLLFAVYFLPKFLKKENVLQDMLIIFTERRRICKIFIWAAKHLVRKCNNLLSKEITLSKLILFKTFEKTPLAFIAIKTIIKVPYISVSTFFAEFIRKF